MLFEQRSFLQQQSRRLRRVQIGAGFAALLGLAQLRPGPPPQVPEANQYLILTSPSRAKVFLPYNKMSVLALDGQRRSGKADLRLVGVTPLYRRVRSEGGLPAEDYGDLFLELSGYQRYRLRLPLPPESTIYRVTLQPSWPSFLWFGPWHWARLHPWGAVALLAGLWACGEATLWLRNARRFREQVRYRQKGIREGVELEGYAVGRQLGQGGMGRVFLARDLTSGETVAIKLLFERTSLDLATRQRFLREIEILRQLSHPNVIHTLGWGEVDSQLYLVLEYVEGSTLDHVWSGRQSPDAVLAVARQIVSALAYVHARGVVHRDLKPSNLLCGEGGKVTLLDFGIASDQSQDSSTIRGTVGYMAPEQIQGKAVDWRADLYSLGVILHEALRGEPLFGGEGAALDRLRNHLQDEAPPLPAETPPELGAFVLRLLQKDPDRRFVDAEEFGEACRQVGLATGGVSARDSKTLEQR